MDVTHVDAVELEAVEESPATERDVVFIHGREDALDVPPGDLIQDQAWGERRLVSPTLGPEFYRQSFEEQIRHLDTLVGDARLAIGFSFGSWLLLTVVAMRQLTDRPVPDLLLLSPILGSLSGPTGSRIAPRCAPRS